MYNYMVEQKEVQRIVDSTYGLVNVQYSISSAHFRGVIDAIRNKALDLSLELYESAPHAGESDADIETTTAAQKPSIILSTTTSPTQIYPVQITRSEAKLSHNSLA